MKLKTIIKLVFTLLVPSIINSQNMPSQIRMDSMKYVCTELITNENDGVVGICLDTPANFSDHLYIIDFSNIGAGTKNAFRFSILSSSSPPPVFRNLIRNKFRFYNNKIFIKHALGLSASGQILISLDRASGSFWYKGIQEEPLFALNEQANSAVLVSGVSGFANLIKILVLNADTGENLWSMGYSTTNLQNEELSPLLTSFHTRPMEGHFIGGILSEMNTASGNYLTNAFILNVAHDGTPLAWKTFGSNLSFEQIYSGQDGIYALCKTDKTYSFNSNVENLVLLKLGFDLTPIWSKVFYAEEFEFNNASLNVADDGTLTLGYSTFGHFPTILAKLDASGNILWQKGYPLYQPELDPLSDGALLMLSRVSSSWNSIKNIISKTDTLGNIENCQTFESCLESTDISLTVGAFNIEIVNADWDTVAPNELLLDTVEFSFSTYCDFPSPPIPDFFAPDTICVMDSITTFGLGNEYAHGTSWHLIGNGVDSTVTDSLVFSHHFDVPGNYSLSQTIWYLGCSHFSERSITVLPPLEVALEVEGDLCEPPANLLVQSNRPLYNFMWNTGDSLHSIEISQNGVYEATVSDGYCISEAKIDTQFVSIVLNGQPALTLPMDTSICEQELPFGLAPTSSFTNEFFLGNIPQGLPIQLNAAGEFEIAALIEGCLFSEVFTLGTEDCSPAIYFPNVFSPNGDGINDSFFPQGNNFVPIGLSIYDRWGGLIFESKNSNLFWDGGRASVGVYAYVFEYAAERTGKVEKTYGSVMLIR